VRRIGSLGYIAVPRAVPSRLRLPGTIVRVTHYVGRRRPWAVRSYVQCLPQGVYRPRNAQASPLYRLVEDHFDQLERVWEERYEHEYGFWRPVVRQAVEQFLDCGDLRCG